ncbi:hypothetical protein Bca101_027548 [Brassica carinata]
MIQSHCYCLSGIVITIYFCLLIHALASPTLHFCRHDQREALLEFRDEFPSSEFYASPWNKSSDRCHWKGVTCDDRYGQVISLDLTEAFLNGSLKANSSLFRLRYLRYLNLNMCELQGEIPSSLGNLSRLTLVDLSDNHLIGEIPASIGYLNNLRELILDMNNLIGKIPSSIEKLSSLTNLELSHNHLIGEIPASIGYLNNLRELILEYNNLIGKIPSSIGNLSSLTNLELSNNHLIGEIPTSIGNLSSLTDLSLSANLLVGEVPASIGNLNGLRVMDLSDNSLSGDFHILFANLTKLTDFDISFNKFTSTLPSDMSGFHNLESFDVSENSFVGPFPKSFFSIPSLQSLRLGENQFTGPIQLGNTSLSSFELQDLDLSYNRFDGPIPEYICEFINLASLYLDHNDFTGSIPRSISKLVKLESLYISNNKFTELSLSNNSFSGVFPDIFVNATHLVSLDVSRNQLEGKFPKSLINCKALQLVNVESNNIKDKFPSWLGSLPLLRVLSLRSNDFYGPLYHPPKSIGFQSLRVIDVSHNDLTGTLPPHYFSSWHEMTTNSELVTPGNDYMEDVYDIFPFIFYRSIEMVVKGVDMRFERLREDFRAIDLSGNRLYGKIPVSLGFLKELHLLNLSHNSFTEDIPRSLAKLTNLETLDLSSNKLSGEIPQDLGNLSFMSYMNFSHNRLQGPVPGGTQFQRQNCSSFTDNPGLYNLQEICGERHVPEPTPQQHEELLEEEEHMFSWVAAAIAYVLGVFCGFVIGYILASDIQEWFTEKFGRRKLRVTTTACVRGDDVWRFGAPVGSGEPRVGSPVVARSGGDVMVRAMRVPRTTFTSSSVAEPAGTMKKSYRCQKFQRLWAKLVMRKWLSKSVSEPEYGADTDEETDKHNVGLEIYYSSSDEDVEVSSTRRRESTQSRVSENAEDAMAAAAAAEFISNGNAQLLDEAFLNKFS